MLETHNGQTATVRPMNVLDNTGALTRAMQRAGREELIRHKKLGNTIATWQDGQVVLVTGDDIVIPDDPDA